LRELKEETGLVGGEITFFTMVAKETKRPEDFRIVLVYHVDVEGDQELHEQVEEIDGVKWYKLREFAFMPIDGYAYNVYETISDFLLENP